MFTTSRPHARRLALVVAALCMTTNSSAGDQAQPGPPALDGSGWQLVSGALGRIAPPADVTRITLKFTAGRVAAHSGCNVGSGGYRVERTALVIGTLATTRMSCTRSIGAWEGAFFAFLGTSPTFDLAGDELVLSSATGRLAWRAMPMPGPNAVRKFVYIAADRAPCTGVAPMMCLQVRDTPDAPWRLHYGEIVGFTHEPGVEYRLRILEDTVARPPADGSSKRWFLDLVIEQRLPQR